MRCLLRRSATSSATTHDKVRLSSLSLRPRVRAETGRGSPHGEAWSRLRAWRTKGDAIYPRRQTRLVPERCLSARGGELVQVRDVGGDGAVPATDPRVRWLDHEVFVGRVRAAAVSE